MHTDRFQTDLIDNKSLQIKNLTASKITSIRVVLSNNQWSQLVDCFIELGPFATQSLPLGNYHFESWWREDKYELLIYVNESLEYKKTFNDKSKCWLTFSNKAFEPLLEQLIIGLSRWTRTPILHYTIGYESQLDYPELINIPYEVQGDLTDGQFMQMVKPYIFLDALDRGYKNIVFIDGDIQVRPNIGTLLDMTSEIIDGPIFQRTIWDYTGVDGKYIPGPLLTEALSLPLNPKGEVIQPAPHGITNLVIFNTTHRDLITTWKETCHSPLIQKIRTEEFMHDELILNCLMWRLGIHPQLRWMGLNVHNYHEVDFFMNYKFTDEEKLVNLNDHNMGHPHQSIFYRDKSLVRFFHCVKDPSMAALINQMILEREG